MGPKLGSFGLVITDGGKEEVMEGEFDVQIINDTTGDFASICGIFYAKNG